MSTVVVPAVLALVPGRPVGVPLVGTRNGPGPRSRAVDGRSVLAVAQPVKAGAAVTAAAAGAAVVGVVGSTGSTGVMG